MLPSYSKIIETWCPEIAADGGRTLKQDRLRTLLRFITLHQHWTSFIIQVSASTKRRRKRRENATFYEPLMLSTKSILSFLWTLEYFHCWLSSQIDDSVLWVKHCMIWYRNYLGLLRCHVVNVEDWHQYIITTCLLIPWPGVTQHHWTMRALTIINNLYHCDYPVY